jgi:undecaprenyl-diphosphatase
MLAVRMVRRLDHHDRGLLDRWALGQRPGTVRRRSWIAITHAGGAVATIGSVVLPLLLGSWPHHVSLRVALALTISHLVVQAIKRLVGRERPMQTAHVRCPDRFSFPSGHATAALAVALSYGLAFPAVALPLVAFALLVGWSRVVLGVHYPGDVIVGQCIAALTVVGLAL